MEPPTRVFGRANKGQNRKRALSTTSPTQASKRTPKRLLKLTFKKASNRQARRRTEPPQQLPSPIFVESSPPRPEQLDEEEEEEEPEEEPEEELDKEEEEEEEEEEPEEQPEEPEEPEEQPEEEPEEEPEELPISFMSRWKAVCGREALPGAVSSKYDTTNLFYHLIERWQDSIIAKCLPRIFTVNRLEAAASYEKQSKTDHFRYEISDRRDLYKVTELLKDLHEQNPTKLLYLDLTLYMTEEKPQEIPAPLSTPSSSQAVRSSKRTATQIQEANLPNIIAAEEAAGNRIPALASRWPCVNSYCSNKGATCWQNRRGNEADRVEHHYPVNAHILQRWSREIQSDTSTVEEPSQNIVCQLSA